MGFEYGEKVCKSNFEKKPKYFAMKIYKYGVIKKPNSMYGMFGWCTKNIQHAVVTNKAVGIVAKYYNKLVPLNWRISDGVNYILNTETCSVLLRNVKIN